MDSGGLRGMNYVGNLTIGQMGDREICAKVIDTYVVHNLVN